RPRCVAGDMGYSTKRVRGWLKAHRIDAVIPYPRTQHPGPRPIDRQTYRRRNVVERCVGWLKEARRIGTRFEKLARQFLGMLKLGLIARYLRKAFSYSA